MSVYLITYDLKRPGQNYQSLHEAIKRLGTNWWHHLESTWLVAGVASATIATNALRRHMDANDFLLVTDIGDDSDGWLPENAWQWIRTHRRAA